MFNASLNPKITIIVTVYNNQQYLNDCLSSLLMQTMRLFKVIVIDDASTEKISFEKEYINDGRFIFFRNQMNIGGPKIFQDQIKDVETDYVMWLHHDDWLHNEFLERTFLALEENQECTFAYSLCSRVINEVARDEFPSAIRPNLETGVHDISSDAVINCWIMWSSALIRTAALTHINGLNDLYDRHNGKPEKSVYRSGESDLYVFARLSSAGPVYAINERLCFYRDHGGSNTQNELLRATHIQDNIRTYDYIFDDIEYFSDRVRIIAKINTIGRLMQEQSIADAAIKLLYHSKLGRELKHKRSSILKSLVVVMRRYIRDDASLGYPTVFSDTDIALLLDHVGTDDALRSWKE